MDERSNKRRRRRGARQQHRDQMADRPSVGASVRQLTVDDPTTWTSSSALAAIREHELGMFQSSGALIDAMGRDDRIRGCVQTRVNALVAKSGLDFAIVPPKGGSQQLADRVSSWWSHVLEDDVLRDMTRDVVMAGVYIGRVSWSRLAREWVPTAIERWHTQNIRWDEDGRQWIVDSTEGQIPIDREDPNWLIIEASKGRAWMSGAVRALGLAYIMRSFNWRDWARFNERHGLPVITITEPYGFDQVTKDRFYRSIRSMGSTGVVRLPKNNAGQGFEIGFQEAKDRAFDTFGQFRRDLDIAIAVCLLGQNLTSEATGGSLALGRVHDRIRQDYLEGDSELLSDALRRELIVRWASFNIPGFRPDDAPIPTWKTEVPEDRKLEAETLSSVADAIRTLQDTGQPVDFAEIFRRTGIPLLPGAQPVANAPANGPAAAAQRASLAHQPARPRLASGDDPTAASGFVEGQTYVDDVVDAARDRVGSAHAPFVQKLLSIVDAASSYEDVRQMVIDAYGSSEPPEQVRDLIHKALVLADLAGRTAVDQDA